MINNSKSYLGPMLWFTGVVEDIDDPKELGRVKVRCYGYHSADVNDIPTAELPWAICISPITSAAMSGIGEGTTGLLQGSWVVGFWRDGETAQDPVILGSIPSVSFKRKLKYGEGFVDPDGEQPRQDGIADIPAMATTSFEDSQFFIKKKNLRQTAVEKAAAPDMSMISGETTTERGTWDCNDPETDIAPLYPANHVKEYESGHIVEFDDTKDKERISTMHKSGTYHEINATGDNTVVVTGNNYDVVFKDNNIYVKGNCHLTVDKDLHTLVKGNYHLEVEKNYTVNVKGSHHEKIGKNYFTDVGQEMFTNVTEDRTLQVGKNELREIELDTKSVVKGTSRTIIRKKQITKVKETSTYLTKGNVRHASTASQMSLESKGNMRINTKSNMSGKASGTITMDGTAIYLN